jgi:putative nucleotidyltransferase with HDIG domain
MPDLSAETINDIAQENLDKQPERKQINMNIPNKELCYRLMGEMKMMDHIVLHSMQVCRVATYLASQLGSQQYRLNRDSIRAAALLHDITKTRSFKTKENHALTGGQFLAERGYPEIGELVRQHVRLDEYAHPVVLSEAEILNYADKRVLHEEVVSLDRRLDYILEKYGQLPEHRQRILWLWQKTQTLEAKIFENLSVGPEDLNRLLNAVDRTKEFLEYQKVCRLRA